MRRLPLALLSASLLAAVLLSGCGTAYRTAMDQRSYEQQKQDALIEVAIKKNFVADDDVKALDIGVYSYLGKVYLVGEYESQVQVDRATIIARAEEGVSDVVTYLLPKKDDPECGWSDNLALETKVKTSLIGDEDISATNIEVESVQCNVVLLGLVGYKQIIGKAVAHAKAVEGVRSVRSYLRVVSE